MDHVFRTDRLPVDDGFAYLREDASGLPAPVELCCDEPTSFHVELRRARLGAVTVESLTTAGPASIQVHRPARLIRRSDPQAYRFLLTVDGHTGVSQGGRDAVLGPGDIGLHDTSRPMRGWRRTHGPAARLLMVVVPTIVLPVHPDTVRQLTGVKLPGDSPVAGLVTSTVTRIADDLARYRAGDAARLSTVVVDLLGVMLGHAFDVPDVVAADAGQRALLARVQAFIEQRLDDPALSPTMVAAAHHVAPRTLGRLFAEHELTVAGWIRHRRLERCRRALANPLLADQPIYAIGTRMGFADGPHFTRAFRAAYGVSPRAYRDQHRLSTLQPTGKPDDEG